MKPQRLGGARLPPPRRLCQCARSAALEALRRIGVVLRDTAGGWFLDVASGDTLLLFLVWLMEAVCVVGGLCVHLKAKTTRVPYPSSARGETLVDIHVGMSADPTASFSTLQCCESLG
jgi:hypothetical protein